ncbi:MAG TPA: 2-amino-4-hydroxy-6-hydroxymethyldihydropteridine diphosphokinase [Pseudomonadales bacterium]
MDNTCYIALGSNLQDPLNQAEQAVIACAALGRISAVSPWYCSKAIGPGEQPDYINGVLCLHTALEPLQLLASLQDIENRQGRQRHIRWGARTLDLDILLYNQLSLSLPDLNLPHPRMHERNFVIYPLYDIAPTLTLPDGRTIATIKAQLDQQGLEKYRQTR